MFRVSCAIIVPYYWVQCKEMFLHLENRWRRNLIQHVPPNLRNRSLVATPATVADPVAPATAAGLVAPATAAGQVAGPVALHHPMITLVSFK